MARRISILGATGSIGLSTLDLIRRAAPGTFEITALTANSSAESLADLALEFRPQIVALANPDNVKTLEQKLSGSGIEIVTGDDGVVEAASRPADFCMAAIVGAAGLAPTLKAVEQGAHLGLANKECLVCAGDLFTDAVKQSGAVLLPVDSEHNAIFQVLETKQPEAVRRIILTASGGPFRTKSEGDLQSVTREDALNHPVWSMGAKISIDSATLFNKGLELIEASYLFDRPSSQIDIIIHPQSVVHSMVEYIDGSVLAQLGSPDMRTPIAYALAWPERMEAPVERLDFAKTAKLEFEAPDPVRFPALRLARAALETGGHAPNIMNAANEIAVEAFLDGRLPYLGIAQTVEATLEAAGAAQSLSARPVSVANVIDTDATARRLARGIIAAR